MVTDDGFAQALLDYLLEERALLCTPGHHGCPEARRAVLGPLAARLLDLDLSWSVDWLSPGGSRLAAALARAERDAAGFFGARRTCFLTTGASSANRVVVRFLAGRDAFVLVDRFSHQSVHLALAASGAAVECIRPRFDARFQLPLPPREQDVLDAMARCAPRRRGRKVLALTQCTYEGFFADLRRIVARAHELGFVVFVDEAWFGHAGLWKRGWSALECGADYVTQSPHKTGLSLGQGALVHVADPGFARREIEFDVALAAEGTTSPSFPILASLDAGIRHLARCGAAAEPAGTAPQAAGQAGGPDAEFVAGADYAAAHGLLFDPCKTLFLLRRPVGTEIARHLRRSWCCEFEKATDHALLALTHVCDREAGEAFSQRLRGFLEARAGEFAPAGSAGPRFSEESFAGCRRAGADRRRGRPQATPVAAAAGRVSAGVVVPYPPGIPLLLPGEVVSPDQVAALSRCLERGTGVLGVRDGRLLCHARRGSGD